MKNYKPKTKDEFMCCGQQVKDEDWIEKYWLKKCPKCDCEWTSPDLKPKADLRDP